MVVFVQKMIGRFMEKHRSARYNEKAVREQIRRWKLEKLFDLVFLGRNAHDFAEDTAEIKGVFIPERCRDFADALRR